MQENVPTTGIVAPPEVFLGGIISETNTMVSEVILMNGLF